MSAVLSQHFSKHHLRSEGPHAIMQVKSRQENHTGVFTGLALSQPYSALVAVAYMPDAGNSLTTGK